jgi:capsular exopolysaccharide synthesis family protein
MSKTPCIANGRQPEEGNSKFPDWREGVAILTERAWLGLTVAAVVFLFFTLRAYHQTAYYRSTATLMVEAQIPKILNYQESLSYNLRNLEYFNTHINALHSRDMMQEALTRSGLLERPGLFPGAETVEARVDAALGRVTLTPVEKSRMITIGVEHPDPQVASDLANALAHAYIQKDLDMRMGTSMEAIEWLQARSEEYREKLEKGLLQLQEYREKTGSVSLEEDQNIVIEKLKALNATLTQAQTERIQVETQWEAIEAQIAGKVPRTKVAALLADPGVQAFLQKLQEQQREVAALQQRYRDRHPDLQRAMEQEARLQRQFELTCEDAFHALKSNYEMLLAREKNLRDALQEQEKEAFDLDRKLVHYNELKRNIEADQEIQRAVISRMKETSVSESLPANVIRLVEEARPAKLPFRPRPAQAMMRGALIGLVLGIGSIFLLYYADHRFRRNEEIERDLGIPVLADIPLIVEKTIRDRGTVSHGQQAGEPSEAFRTLRASLLLPGRMSPGSVLMITSAAPGEGKSLIAANLALSLAQDGRRTLLVGADLRRPMLDQMFDAGKDPKGLTDVLKGDIGWQAALRGHETPNLDVLLAGRLSAHPSELLGHTRFADFLREARGQYQHILIDAPPLLGISDSLVILPKADGVLLVVRYGVTHSLGARQAMLKVRESGTPCLGCILNGVNFNSISNHYYYRRYGGYAYRQYQAGTSESPHRPTG